MNCEQQLCWCESLEPHLRIICRGERHDLSLGTVNTYRRLWNLPSLSPECFGGGSNAVEDQDTPTQSARSLGSGVGTNLAALLKAVGIDVKDGCGCEEWIIKMNAWTIEQNIEHRQEIIEHLKDRAAEARMSIVETAWTGLLLIFNRVPPTISGLVDEAIRRAKEVAEQDGAH